MNHHLCLYESIAAATGRMLAAAREARWDALVEHERDCSTLVERLKSLPDDDGLDSAGRRRKAELLERMLADDRAIRELTQPELARLSLLLKSPGHEARLRRAYRQPGEL